MTESGGPTTQAGINYQNCIAALYLGDLLSLDEDESARVVTVRVEAPAHVDDIVVGYSDGRQRWFQVKLALRSGGSAWRKLWHSFDAQQHDPEFKPGDRLSLTIGERTGLVGSLQECVRRAAFACEAEWHSRLTQAHRRIVGNIEDLLGHSSFSIFQSLDVNLVTEDQIAGTWALERIPNSNLSKSSLFAILRGIVSSGASRRETHQAPTLRSRLRSEHSVRLEAPIHWGLPIYLETLSKVMISVPGTNVGGHPANAFFWPRAAQSDEVNQDFDDEQLHGWHESTVTEVDLRIFPTPQLSQCIIHAGPGFGKSALLAAIAERTSSGGSYVPAIVPLASLAEAKCEILEYLQDVINRENLVRIDWKRLCETGSALVLLDGLDEVALDQRVLVMQKVERFARRFSSVPWMLTVRDTAVLPAGFDAQKLELLPLATAEMAAFVQFVKPSIGPAAAERLIDQAVNYPDLERLLHIPLFLALMVATWNPEEPLPKKRGDLIEAYLKTLFRPEEHKAVTRAVDPERLREVMQSLAYRLVDTGEIGASERLVRKLLAECAGRTIGVESLFDDALRCGILRRSSSIRLAFPFPIVQEYLAGQELFEKHCQQIPDRAARALERPWAQTVQFSLEKLSDGSEIARAMLDAPDDAFATGVRLLARCILNGMACSADVRESVGARLARVWHRQSFWTSRRIGQLLKDGWSDSPTKELRKALHRRSLLHDGAAEILAKLEDDDLTLSVLRSYLLHPDHLGCLNEFQIAVDRVSGDAFSLYLDAVRSGKWDEDISGAASLIGRLDPSGIPKSDLSEVFNDETIPTGVRIAVFGLSEGLSLEVFWRLANEALSQPRASDHWPAIKALRKLPDREAHLQALLRNAKLPPQAHYSILDRLDEVLPDRAFQQDFLKLLAESGELSSELRVRMLIRAASYGDRVAFEDLLSRFNVLSTEHVERVLHVLSEFPERVLGEKVIAMLRSRDFSPHEKVGLADALLLGATYRLENPSYDFSGLISVPPHQAYAKIVGLIAEWRAAEDFDLPDKLAMETTAARMRLPGAGTSLRRLVTEIVSNHSISGTENPLNDGIRAAIGELRSLRIRLDLRTAIQLAETADSNARIGALYHIGSIGTREALDYLLVRSKCRDDDYSIIFQEVEAIASRLGLKILETQGGLSIAPPKN